MALLFGGLVVPGLGVFLLLISVNVKVRLISLRLFRYRGSSLLVGWSVGWLVSKLSLFWQDKRWHAMKKQRRPNTSRDTDRTHDSEEKQGKAADL